MRKITVSVLILLLTVPLGASDTSSQLSQDPRVRQALRLFEMWVEAKLAYDRIPGLSVGLVSDQELVWSKGFGYADVAQQKPTTPETVYSICSISKLFTSVAIMRQYEQGLLRLDDEIGNLLPWMSITQSYPESGPITVRSLLTHSSGLPRESNHPYWTGPDFPFPTREEVIQGLGEQKTLYPASRFFQYSNLGMSLLGQVVEQKSGKKYEDYVRQAILQPLKLKNTTPYLPEGREGNLLARGYSALSREGKRHEMELFQARGIAPAAGFASNVVDLARFASWQFQVLDGSSAEVLNASTLREMQRVHWVDPNWSTHWGLGFVVSQREGETVVGHGGSCPGYRTALSLVPKKKLAGIGMINAMGTNPSTFVTELFKLVGPILEKVQSKPDPPKVNSDFEKYAGLYRSSWGETAIVPWEDGLAMLGLPSNSPAAGLTRLEHVEGHVFRRIRKDDPMRGEKVIFAPGRDGTIQRFSQHGNFSEKVM